MNTCICICVDLCLLCCVHHRPLSSDPPAPPCYIESVSSVPPDLPCYTESVGIKLLRVATVFIFHSACIYIHETQSINTSTVTNGELPNSSSPSVQWTRGDCLHDSCLWSINFNFFQRSEVFQACHHPIRCVRSCIQLKVNRCQISLLLRNSEDQVTIDGGAAYLHRLAEL